MLIRDLNEQFDCTGLLRIENTGCRRIDVVLHSICFYACPILILCCILNYYLLAYPEMERLNPPEHIAS